MITLLPPPAGKSLGVRSLATGDTSGVAREPLGGRRESSASPGSSGFRLLQHLLSDPQVRVKPQSRGGGAAPPDRDAEHGVAVRNSSETEAANLLCQLLPTISRHSKRDEREGEDHEIQYHHEVLSRS